MRLLIWTSSLVTATTAFVTPTSNRPAVLLQSSKNDNVVVAYQEDALFFVDNDNKQQQQSPETFNSNITSGITNGLFDVTRVSPKSFRDNDMTTSIKKSITTTLKSLPTTISDTVQQAYFDFGNTLRSWDDQWTDYSQQKYQEITTSVQDTMQSLPKEIKSNLDYQIRNTPVITNKNRKMTVADVQVLVDNINYKAVQGIWVLSSLYANELSGHEHPVFAISVGAAIASIAAFDQQGGKGHALRAMGNLTYELETMLWRFGKRAVSEIQDYARYGDFAFRLKEAMVEKMSDVREYVEKVNTPSTAITITTINGKLTAVPKASGHATLHVRTNSTGSDDNGNDDSDDFTNNKNTTGKHITTPSHTELVIKDTVERAETHLATKVVREEKPPSCPTTEFIETLLPSQFLPTPPKHKPNKWSFHLSMLPKSMQESEQEEEKQSDKFARALLQSRLEMEQKAKDSQRDLGLESREQVTEPVVVMASSATASTTTSSNDAIVDTNVPQTVSHLQSRAVTDAEPVEAAFAAKEVNRVVDVTIPVTEQSKLSDVHKLSTSEFQSLSISDKLFYKAYIDTLEKKPTTNINKDIDTATRVALNKIREQSLSRSKEEKAWTESAALSRLFSGEMKVRKVVMNFLLVLSHKLSLNKSVKTIV